MKNTNSLVSKLTRSLLLAVGCAWIAIAVSAAWLAQSEVNESMDSALVDTAQRLIDLAAHDLVVHNQAPGQALTGKRDLNTSNQVGSSNANFSDDHIFYQVVNADHAVLLRSTDAPAAALKVPLENGFTELEALRVYTYKQPERPLYIHVADSLDHRSKAESELMLTMLLPMLLVLPMLAWLIYAITRAALAEVQTIADEIAQRHGADLRPLPDGDRSSEIEVIAINTNRLLLRLGDALDTEKSLAANAAHELRTPLATAQLRLHALLGMSLDAASRAEATMALESLVQLNRRAEKLLQLSRAESGATLTYQPIQLTTLAATVVQEFWSDPKLLDRIQLHTPEDDDVVALGDFDAIAIVVRNLIENAVRHAPNSLIDVMVETPALIRVRDQGPGVDPRTLGLIRLRHVKSQRDATGYGLGMSIISTVVTRHQGRLELLSPPPGLAQGFEAQVHLLPASAALA